MAKYQRGMLGAVPLPAGAAALRRSDLAEKARFTSSSWVRRQRSLLIIVPRCTLLRQLPQPVEASACLQRRL